MTVVTEFDERFMLSCLFSDYLGRRLRRSFFVVFFFLPVSVWGETVIGDSQGCTEINGPSYLVSFISSLLESGCGSCCVASVKSGFGLLDELYFSSESVLSDHDFRSYSVNALAVAGESEGSVLNSQGVLEGFAVSGDTTVGPSNSGPTLVVEGYTERREERP